MMARHVRRITAWTLRSLGTLIVVYVLVSVLGALIPGRVDGVAAEASGPRNATAYLVAGPIHNDFLLPLTPDTRDALASLAGQGIAVDDPSMRWLLIGWGAHGFYTTTGSYADVNLPSIWRAVTGDNAVMRAQVLGPIAESPDLPRLSLTQAELTRLTGAIMDDLKRDSDGALIVVPDAGFTTSDRFFEAKGRFNLRRTCNTWVGEVLRKAGLSFGIWTPTPLSVRVGFWLHQS